MHSRSDVDVHAKVRIVDDDDAFRNGLTRVLNASGLEAVSYSCAGEYLIAESEDSPGCVLLDINMPGPSGLDLWDALVARDVTPATIFLTGCSEVPISVRAMKAGAIDFISKPVEVPRLLAAVQRALAVDSARRNEQILRHEIEERLETLESGERAVFTGVVNGKLNKQLAGELDKCERTIKTYRAQMMSKLNVQTLSELVRMAWLMSRPVQKMTRIGGFPDRMEPTLDETDDGFYSKLC